MNIFRSLRASYPAFIAPVIILLLLIGNITPAQAALAGEWARTASDLEPDPLIHYGQLDNGMRFAVMPNQTPAKQASIRLLFDVGSKHEYDDEQGLAHFLEHMAFNGSKNVPEGEMVKILERHGLAFGADVNAYTSYDQTVYQLDLPNVKSDTINTAFMLMREIASNISLNADAIDRERGVVLAEKRRENVHALRTRNARLEFAYPGTRILARSPIGTEKTILAMTAEQMKRFYRAFYRPERAFFVVVGDFNPDQIAQEIQKTFADWQALGDARDTTYAQDPAQIGTDTTIAGHFQNENGTTSVGLSLTTPYKAKPDTRENRKKSALTFAANAILGTRYSNLQQQGKAAYLGAGASVSSFNKIATSAFLGVNVEDSKWEAGFRDALLEWKRVLSHGYSQAELAELLANLRTRYEYSVNSADKRPTAGLANYILSAYVNEKVAVTPQTQLDLFNEFSQSVTPEALLAEFKTLWSGAPAKLFLVSEGLTPDADAKLLAAYQDSLDLVLDKTKEKAQQTFAYTDFGTPGTIAERHTVKETSSTAIRFENNVMLNIKKTDFQQETVHLSLRFGGGLLSVPKEQPGLTTLFARTFSAGGVKAHSATDLQRLLAGKTASANIGAGADHFGFQGAVTPQDLLLQLQLWAAYITAPAYREEPIVQYRRSLDSVYHALDNTAGQVARYQIGRLLYSGDKRFYLPPKDAISRLTASDIKNFIGEPLAKSAIELTIVGDIDIEETIKAVAATFGALPMREANPRPYKSGRIVTFPAAGRAQLYHKGSDDQAIYRVYWPTADFTNIVQSAHLDILGAVFNNRLRETVREKLGASYGPNVSNVESDVFPGFGYMVAAIDIKPDDIAKIRTVITTEIASMIADGFTDDEIERARQPLLESIQNAEKSNGHWLGRISTSVSDPASVKTLAISIEAWSNATSPQLQALVSEFLKPETAFEVSILPASMNPENGATAQNTQAAN